MSPPSRSRSSAAKEPSKLKREREEKAVPQKKFGIALLKEATLSLSDLREICDLCFKGRLRDSNGEVRCGASVTCRSADEFASYRDKAKLALQFYKKKARVNMNLELVKVCKANSTDGGYYGLTFTAAERGSDEGLVFRGVFRFKKVLYCEIKDEIKLVPSYVGSSKSNDEKQSGQPMDVEPVSC